MKDPGSRPELVSACLLSPQRAPNKGQNFLSPLTARFTVLFPESFRAIRGLGVASHENAPITKVR